MKHVLNFSSPMCGDVRHIIQNYLKCLYIILYFSIQIDSHASCSPLSISKFGRGHASRRPLSNLPGVTRCPKPPEKCKKVKFFPPQSEFLRNFGAVTRTSGRCRMSNWYFWSSVTPPVDLNGKNTVYDTFFLVTGNAKGFDGSYVTPPIPKL
jgi:hypothetical protein